ncbi:Bone morphogenetic protein 3 [Saguinus oedipus]|uniref:Bone morphogenetic protein 3 n=1 Tax=Saguinus oedipus TaxID=9490 RepID=A0ABQ9W2P5_SAGOE|nr:Bone morphogenetic protein 3 [Saguinus oedipus]
MAGVSRLLFLWLGCFCVSLAQGERPKRPFPELRKAVPGDRTAGGGRDSEMQPQDKVSEHMLRLYDRYSTVQAARTPGSLEGGSQPRRPQPLREGNTVRSFRAGAAAEIPLDWALAMFTKRQMPFYANARAQERNQS